MANKLKKKFIGADQVGSAQLLIEKNVAVRATLQDDSVVSLINLNSSDEVMLKGIKVIDSSGLIPAAILPSYVDDVLEFANLAAFPVTGEAGKIYVAVDTNKTYRWSGSAYIYITSGAVDSVNGETGVVVLDAGDISMVSEATTIEAKLVSLQGEVDQAQTDITAVEGRMTTAEGEIDALQAEDIALDGRLDTAESEINALQAEDIALDGRIDTLEAYKASLDALVKIAQKITLSGTNITNGYIDLAHEVSSLGSLLVFVDRLVLHPGAAEDYSVSVVGGVTRITFLNDLVSPGSQALSAGDNIFARYSYAV